MGGDNVSNRIIEALKEVNQIRKGEKPKRNWRGMVERVREETSEDESKRGRR